MSSGLIRIRGARQHNLKNLDLDIRTGELTVVTGPSGSGKSSTAREVARRLGLGYLDTGAMYRAVTVAFLEAGISPDDHDAVVAATTEADIDHMVEAMRATLDAG